MSGHYTSGGKERWHKRQDAARLSQFRAESESKLPTNLQWSLQSKDARKTPETSFVRSCLPHEIPVSAHFRAKNANGECFNARAHVSRFQSRSARLSIRLVTIDAFLGRTRQFGLCNFRNWAPKVRLAVLNFGCRLWPDSFQAFQARKKGQLGTR